jgi:GNAT superfamily N-acetyltransferase
LRNTTIFVTNRGGSGLREVKVRKFQQSDVEDVLEIFTEDGLIHNEEERERTWQSLEKSARQPEWYDHYLVAEMDGRVVGRVLLESAYPPYSELINLYVLSEFRGIGVGSRLVQSCIETASTHNSSVITVMADPVGNPLAHRLYSKFGFRPGILGDPSLKRGHMWLFRLSEETCISEFLGRHPFAEPKVSHSKVNFHNRMLYQMSWTDTQTWDKMDLFIEGQPSQTPEGTMPRISGVSYKEEELGLEALVREQSATIRQGETSGFTVSFWNLGSKPMELSLSGSISEGTYLSPMPENFSPLEIELENEKTLQFGFTWLSRGNIPDYTSFSTVISTCFFAFESFKHPSFVSSGFDMKKTRN